jgi:stearoyl-CoA desaturase (delta-9 desaturase)
MRTTRADGVDRAISLTTPGLWAMVAIHLGALLAFLPAARPGATALTLMAVTLSLRTFAVSAGFHRYFSHRSFRVGRVVQFLLAFIGGMGAMRSALWWASQHVQHHRYSDEPGDPHSPREGLFHSHMGWFMIAENQETRWEYVKDFRRFPELVWLDKYEWVPLIGLNVLCYAIGGFAGWVWGCHVSTLLLCHATFGLNSITHSAVGSRRYDTPDDSTNFLPVALATFGEGWHNNHHRHPGRARLGEGLAEVDVTWVCLLALERVGLVKDLHR